MAIVGIVTVAALLSSCAQGDANAGTATTGQVEAGTSGNPLAGKYLPIEPILYASRDDAALLDQAVDSLAADCMAERGYDFVAHPVSPYRTLDVEFRYGYLPARDAAVLGYQRVAKRDADYEAGLDAIDAENGADSDDYTEALYGTDSAPYSGCMTVAEKEIFGHHGGLLASEGFQEILEINLTSGDEMDADPAVIELQRRWSACMAEHGYEFERWFDAFKIYWRAEYIAPDQAEIEQAKVDSGCRSQLNFEATLFEVEQRIQNRLVEENAGLIEAFKSDTAAAVARAKAVLDSPAE